jgi:hypothetical protein
MGHFRNFQKKLPEENNSPVYVGIGENSPDLVTLSRGQFLISPLGTKFDSQG